MATQKEVIYVDVEDDITAVIDRVSDSNGDVIALVLPKKAQVFKSSVNLKLLKRASEKQKKKTILITTDKSLHMLAGSTGVLVASGLKEKPEVPTVPKAGDSQSGDVVMGANDSEQSDATKDALSKTKEVKQSSSKSKSANSKKKSSIKVPNFDAFRNKMILGIVALVGLIVAWIVMFRVMPTATIDVVAQTSRLPIEVDFRFGSSDDFEKPILKPEKRSITRTITERYTASGERDVGSKATGFVTLQNCDDSDVVSVPSGVVITDNVVGYAFVATESVEVPGAYLESGDIVCGTADVDVRARNSGDDKNISPRSYTISGYSDVLSAFGAQMSGGTTEVVKVVAQSDIDEASAKLLARTADDVKAELISRFGDDFIVAGDTYMKENGDIQVSEKAGSEATEGSVSAEVTYSMQGLEKSKLDEFLRAEQAKKIDQDALAIIDSGIDEAEISVISPADAQATKLSLSANGYVGPEINTDELAAEVEGMKYSQVIETVKSKPGVKEVDVKLSPFWVFSAPSKDKITINIEVQD